MCTEKSGMELGTAKTSVFIAPRDGDDNAHYKTGIKHLETYRI